MKKKRDVYNKNMKKLQKFITEEKKDKAIDYINIEKIIIESPKK